MLVRKKWLFINTLTVNHLKWVYSWLSKQHILHVHKPHTTAKVQNNCSVLNNLWPWLWLLMVNHCALNRSVLLPSHTAYQQYSWTHNHCALNRSVLLPSHTAYQQHSWTQVYSENDKNRYLWNVGSHLQQWMVLKLTRLKWVEACKKGMTAGGQHAFLTMTSVLLTRSL